jgi:transcriptional regulator with XRE-family HTH domain
VTGVSGLLLSATRAEGRSGADGEVIHREIFAAIETRRQRLGLPRAELTRRAGVCDRHYRRCLSRSGGASLRMARALMSAIEREEAARGAGDRADARVDLLVAAAFRAAISMLAEAWGVPAEEALALDPRDGRRGRSADAATAAAHRARAAALTIVNQALGVRQADLARVAGVSRAAVCQAIARIERERDEDRGLDALVRRACVTLIGADRIG